MKKIVIILLTVLPIFLIVVISFAGRIFSEVVHINVEKVEFVDKTENPLNDTLELSVGQTYQLLHKVYPVLATNKNVTYTSSDENICTVDSNGLITTGDIEGQVTIVIKTEEHGLTDRLTVIVSKTKIESVSIKDSTGNDIENIQMSVGETIQLDYEIKPLATQDKNVLWSSSDENIVFVDSRFGTIVARAPGSAVITVTTNDGGLSDTLIVTVDDNKPKLSFDFDRDVNFTKLSGGYTTLLKEFNIHNYLLFDHSIINQENIKIQITGPASYDTTTGNVVITGNGVVTITATLMDGSGISISVKLLIND